MTAFVPSMDELIAASDRHRRAVVSASVVADGDTPLSLFARLDADRGGAFLLESVEGGARTGRWSFFGSGLEEGIRAGETGLLRYGPAGAHPLGASGSADPLPALRAFLAEREVYTSPELPPFSGGLVGFVAFDALARFERVPLAPPRAEPTPELELLWAEELYAYDHATHRLHALARIDLADLDREIARVRPALEARLARLAEPVHLSPFSPIAADPAGLTVTESRERADYEAAVRRAKQAILEGEIFQVVISTRFSVQAAVAPLSLYRALRASNPSPYMFLLKPPEGPTLVGASPEVLVRVQGGEVLVRPIAGTRRRGRTTAEDVALEQELGADEKERAEHTMLLDLGRNDVGRVARLGSVRVSAPMHVERYAHVMHLVSDVHGELAPDKDAFDAFRAGFPAGTVSGAPKIRAIELLAELEPDRRGVYAGAVGYFDCSGGMDTCIAIRTAVVHPDRVEVQAGAGIVHDSDPAREYEECRSKARSPLAAVALATTAIDPRGGA